MPNFSHRNRRGNYMMLMGSMLPIFVGFAALSVDVSYINMAHVQAQHTADAASHAAFVAFRATNDFDAGNDAAQFIIEENLIGNQEGGLAAGYPKYGRWDFNAATNQFTETSTEVNSAVAKVARDGTAANKLDLFFAPLLGHKDWSVEGYGTTAGRTRQIMLVQDVSCSFGGKDILNSRDADVAFLKYLHNNPYPDDKLGMTLFGGRVWYPVLQELALVEPNYSAPGKDANKKPNAMLERFKKMNYCRSLPGWSKPSPKWGSKCNTTQARGLVQARDEFTDRGNSKEFQAVILISDGLPNQGLDKSGNEGKANSERAIDQLWGKNSGGADRRNWTYKALECKSKWSQCNGKGKNNNSFNKKTMTEKTYNTTFDGGVHVWTVTFNEGGGDFSWMGTLTRGMGRAYETPDSSELEDIMIEIASSIPVVLTE